MVELMSMSEEYRNEISQGEFSFEYSTCEWRVLQFKCNLNFLLNSV